MIRKRNHFRAAPDTRLAGGIYATEVLPPVADDTAGGRAGMSSHKIWVPPHDRYPPHRHPAPHVIVILEGGGSGNVGTPGGEDYTEFPLEAGDVFYVPGETRHQVGADGRGMIMLAVSVGSLRLDDPGRLVVVD